jgi:exopolyphosphatase / guanosine-5'-triphosphate,3'-diphosphate pyrophosphatase
VSEQVYASIDTGSNSLRLLVARHRADGLWETLHTETRITRLSGGFDQDTALLAPESMDRTVAVLADYAKIIQRLGAAHVEIATTGITRKANNTPEFLARIADETGLPARMITGEEEAELALNGALFRLGPRTGPFVFLDIGGSSTELSVCDGDVRRVQSLNLGSVELTERLVRHDPPTDEDLSAVFKAAHFRVAEGYEFLRAAHGGLPGRLVGTAGTVTTVAAIHLGMGTYEPGRVEGLALTLPIVADILIRLSRMPVADRLSVPGLPKGREDVIVAGLIIIQCVMELGGYRELIVTEGSLLEGLLLAAAPR